MSVQISSHRNERFHEKTRHWERTHQKVLAMEHQRQKDGEYKTGESEAYIQAKLQVKRDRIAKVDRDNYAKSRAEVRRLEFEEAERKRIAKEERLRIDAFAAEKRRLDRIAEREMRESVAEKLRQKEAYNAQTQGILDWQQAKAGTLKRRAMEAEDARRAELKRVRDEHDAVLNQAAKDDFQARIDQARARRRTIACTVAFATSWTRRSAATSASASWTRANARFKRRRSDGVWTSERSTGSSRTTRLVESSVNGRTASSRRWRTRLRPWRITWRCSTSNGR